MLAGARGEEIDEFDIKARQKILALERLLVTNGTHVVATKSPETVANAIETVLLPLRTITLHALEKFSRLVKSVTAEYYEHTRDGVSNIYRPLGSRDDTHGVAESGKLVLHTELFGVRSVGQFNNQQNWDFAIKLFDDRLEVRCDSISIRLDVRYDTVFSDEQVRSVDQALTEHAIKWLQDVTGIDIEKVFSR